MALGAGLARAGGYPFEVRYSDGALARARAAAGVAANAYGYFSRLFAGVEPDIALIVAGEADWKSRQPYGLPFFNDDDGQIRPGIVVMPAGSGDFWRGMGQDTRGASPRVYARSLATYPDGADGLVRFWDFFHGRDQVSSAEITAAALAPLLRTEVSETLGRAIQNWR
jgi:hypothetical protein